MEGAKLVVADERRDYLSELKEIYSFERMLG